MLDHNKLYGRMLVFTLAASAVFSSQCFAAADRTLAEYAEIGTAVLRAPAKMAHTYAYAANDPRQKLAHVLSYTLCIVNDSLSIYNHRGSKSLYHEYTRLAHDLLSGTQAVSSMLNNDVLIDGVSVEEQQRLTQISAALCYVLPLIESAGATYAATTSLGATPKEDVVKKHQLAAGLTSLAHYLGEYLKTNDNPMIGYARLALIAETTGLMAYQQLSATEQEKFEAEMNNAKKTTNEQLKQFVMDNNKIAKYHQKMIDLDKKVCCDFDATLGGKKPLIVDIQEIEDFFNDVAYPKTSLEAVLRKLLEVPAPKSKEDDLFVLIAVLLAKSKDKHWGMHVKYKYLPSSEEMVQEIVAMNKLELFCMDKMTAAKGLVSKLGMQLLLNNFRDMRKLAIDLLLEAQKTS